MNLNDLKNLFTGPVLINLDRIITPKLITLFYLGGLTAIGLLSINHLFFSFRFGFGNGLWSILEITVFSTLAFILLRAICEVALIFFKSHEKVVTAHNRSRRLATSPSLIEDVRAAIEDLAQDDAPAEFESKTAPRQTSATEQAEAPVKRASPRRTARRAPRTTKSRASK